MLENRVKRIIRDGGMAFGAYAGNFLGPAIVEVIGYAGLDAVFIDMEHTGLDLADVQTKILAAERVGITPIVRVPGFDPAFVLRVLDIGAQGIVIPHLDGVEDARAVVKAVRFPPAGDRGMAPATRSAEYGNVPFAQHLEQANREVLLMVNIESLGALNEIEAIASVEGLDMLLVGPADLAGALGVAGQADHPKLGEAINRIVEAARKSGNAHLSISMGLSMFPRSVEQMRAMGVRYSNLGPEPEVRLYRSYTQQLAEIRQPAG